MATQETNNRTIQDETKEAIGKFDSNEMRG